MRINDDSDAIHSKKVEECIQRYVVGKKMRIGDELGATRIIGSHAILASRRWKMLFFRVSVFSSSPPLPTHRVSQREVERIPNYISNVDIFVCSPFIFRS